MRVEDYKVGWTRLGSKPCYFLSTSFTNFLNFFETQFSSSVKWTQSISPLELL